MQPCTKDLLTDTVNQIRTLLDKTPRLQPDGDVPLSGSVAADSQDTQPPPEWAGTGPFSLRTAT
eukprot:8736140-Prorocentrum_lima.AAC.1